MVWDVLKPNPANVIIPRALRTKGVTDGKVKKWPDTDVELGCEDGAESDAAEALIDQCIVQRILLESLC
jgi:hypothetical protein